MIDINQTLIDLISGNNLELVLPLIILFALLFAIFNSSNMFSRNVSIILGLAISVLVLFMHIMDKYPDCWDIVVIINNSLPQLSLVFIAIVLVIAILAVTRLNVNMPDWLKGFLGFLAFATVFYIFFNSRGDYCEKIPFMTFLVWILGFGLAYAILRGLFGRRQQENNGEEKNEKNPRHPLS